MLLAYEGNITKEDFPLAERVLRMKPPISGNISNLKIYWDDDERAPIVEINPRGMDSNEVSKLSEYCINHDFMVTHSRQ